MAYLAPSEFVTKMVDAGESKIFMATRDVLIRAYMAGAILALAAVFAVTASVMTGQPLVGAILFPVGFCMLYLLGFDLLTGVFVLTPLAWLDKRPGVTISGILKNWGLVFTGNFLGALTVAFMMSFVFTYGFSTAPNDIGTKIGHIGEARTLGYAQYGLAGWLTIFMRGMPNEPQIGAKYFASKQLAFLIDHVFLSCSASSPINGDESMETVVVSRCLFSTPQSPFSSQAETALDPRQLSSPS